MRKNMRILLVVVLLLCLIPQTCFAIMYANRDANYPIWSTGNHGGSALDLSSCAIKRDNENEIVICALDYVLTYTGGDGRIYENGVLEPNGYVYFIEYKKTGEAIIFATGMRYPLEVRANSYEREVFSLVRHQVGR